MRFVNPLKLSLAAVAFASLAPAAALAVPTPHYDVACKFPGEVDQDVDCKVKIRYCVTPAGTIAPTDGTDGHTCVNYLKAKCGKRTVFKGGYTTAPISGGLAFIGIPNDKYPTSPRVEVENPDSMAVSRVDANFEWNGIDREGTCYVKRVGFPVPPPPPPVPTPVTLEAR